MYLAHSPKGSVPAQFYADHVHNVVRSARRNARRACLYYSGDRQAFLGAVARAALFHDLGKLDDNKQRILVGEGLGRLPPPPHEEAGVAHLVNGNDLWAAALVAAHHKGLFNGQEQRERRNSKERPPLLRCLDEAVFDAVDSGLEEWLQRHNASGCAARFLTPTNPPDQVALRLGLSCLVDADHSDTAAHYDEPILSGVKRRWSERLAALDDYVASKEKESDRDRRRQALYDALRKGEVCDRMACCEAPVGSGKTFAVMANLLGHAKKEGLRHIFVVLPFTNIIDQAVDEYRKALVLPGEQPDDVVVALHHLADFSSLETRRYAALWRAPIIVTTAASFFETLAGSTPGRLRKLHELAGSAIFVDEAHAALPPHLWALAWQWLEKLSDHWGVRVVLGSGSLFHFWSKGGYFKEPSSRPVPDITPSQVQCELLSAECKRLQPQPIAEALTLGALVDRVKSQPGATVIVVNTLRTAASLASLASKMKLDVLHLSTALAPRDRKPIVDKIRWRLAQQDDQPWLVVATSCIEAGLDFSFRRAYREASTVASLLQVGGRVRRNEEEWAGELYCMTLTGAGCTQHPAFAQTSPHLMSALLRGDFSKPVHELLQLEFSGSLRQSLEDKRDSVLQSEMECRYPAIQQDFRVIDSDTRLVLIDGSIADAVERWERVPFREIVQSSVQIYASKLDSLPCRMVGNRDIYRWTGEYDHSFLGYLADSEAVRKLYEAGGALV